MADHRQLPVDDISTIRVKRARWHWILPQVGYWHRELGSWVMCAVLVMCAFLAVLVSVLPVLPVLLQEEPRPKAFYDTSIVLQMAAESQNTANVALETDPAKLLSLETVYPATMRVKLVNELAPTEDLGDHFFEGAFWNNLGMSMFPNSEFQELPVNQSRVAEFYRDIETRSDLIDSATFQRALDNSGSDFIDNEAWIRFSNPVFVKGQEVLDKDNNISVNVFEVVTGVILLKGCTVEVVHVSSRSPKSGRWLPRYMTLKQKFPYSGSWVGGNLL